MAAFHAATMPRDAAVLRALEAQAGLVPFDITVDLPFWRDPDVREVSGERRAGGGGSRPRKNGDERRARR